ncbi:MAG: nitrilase-related carbon-nitrogen hydrolase [Rhodospirillaceae bacterium]|nr:nitrilase-related carbon-nitrogen hydrolase [Rhodospirillaceae bacterium]
MASPTPWTACCVQAALPQDAMAAARTRADVTAIVRESAAMARRLIDSANADDPCDLFLFPEFFFTGGRGHNNIGVVPFPGPEIELIRRVAADGNVFIGANLYTRDERLPGRYLNTSMVFDRSGAVALRSFRLHTNHSHSPHDFWTEFLDKFGIEGAFPVAATDLGNLAILPSMELLIPEVARAFVLRGAEVLLHTTADGMVDQAVKRTRAMENIAYVVSCNMAGRRGGSPSIDVGSRIIDWRGDVLAGVEHGAAGTCRARIDVSGLRDRRADPDLTYQDRVPNLLARLRPDAFRDIYAAGALFPPNTYDPVTPAEAGVDPKSSARQFRTAMDNMAASGIPLGKRA